ncbi:MAG TPA: class I SAM-dependent methyltransferase [Bacteroidales bacterium]|nr:class I SAM-dependent methyltransferase [Bacteroidales bacterium]
MSDRKPTEISILDIDAEELGRQLSRPTGEMGVVVSNQMNLSNATIYELMFGLLSIESRSNILEIGIGNGKYLKEYFNKNKDIRLSCVDLSETMVKIAKETNMNLIKENLVRIICQDSRSLPFENEKFDSVICINTIYFWENLTEQLKELHRVLKPGGRLYIGFRPKSIMENQEFTAEKFRLYEPSDVEKYLQNASFKINRVEQNEIDRISIEGKPLKAIDICVVSEKL